MPAKTSKAGTSKAKAPAKKAATTKTAAKTPAKTATKKAATTKAKASPAKKAPSKTKAASKPATASKKAPKKTSTAKTSSVAKKAPAKKAAVKTSTKESKKSVTTASAVLDDYMNEEDKNHFRQILNAWKAELMVEVDRTVSHMKDEASNFPDPADRASQEEEFSLELRTRDRERKLIRKIDATLELIENDDYGFCEACGIEIGVKRLEARPTATLCIDCKTLDEIKERQELG